MNLLLHIGRHKSGTSSIQHWLMINKKALLKQGVLYPDAGRDGVAHHLIARGLSRSSVRRHGVDPELYSYKEMIFEEASLFGCEGLILSSEAFQNCNPKDVKEFFYGWNVRVCFYIRDPVSYISSAYAQKIHATSYAGSPSEFIGSSKLSYFKFISDWNSEFDNVFVSIFDRDILKDNCVIEDFKAFLSDSLGERDLNCGFTSGLDDKNPSLSSSLVDFKRRLNSVGFLLGFSKKGLSVAYQVLGSMVSLSNGDRFLIERDLFDLDKILEDLARTNDYLGLNPGIVIKDTSSGENKEISPIEFARFYDVFVKELRAGLEKRRLLEDLALFDKRVSGYSLGDLYG